MPFRSPPLHIVWASFPLCSYTWLLAQGCVYLHTEAKSNQTKEHRRHKHRVSRVHFWAPQSRKEPGIASRRFLLASSRTALEQHTTVTFSCLRIAASAGSSSTTTLPWVGDKILSLVPPSLHVWVVLKQRREKYSSDLTPVLGGQPSHSTLFLPSDLKHESSYITFNTVPDWQRWGLCRHVCQWLQFCNKCNRDWHTWPRASPLFSLLSAKWGYNALTSKGATGISQLFSNCFGHGKLKINFEVLSQRGYRVFFPWLYREKKRCLKINQHKVGFYKNFEILFCCYMWVCI